MDKGLVGRIILAKVLSLPLRKYLAFLEDMTQERQTTCAAADSARIVHPLSGSSGTLAVVAQVSNLLYRGFPIRQRPDLPTTSRLEVGGTAGWKPALQAVARPPCELYDLAQKKQVYAQVVVEDGAPGFRVTDPRLLKIYPVPESSDDRRACSLNWINTRNRFSAHIADKLLQGQRDYWLSGREVDLRPLSLHQFLALYPLAYLDASRLSRVVARLWVLTPRQELICLKRLFPSRKRVAALGIKELVDQSPRCLKDHEVQSELARQGVHLSVRTICNCRKLLNIPNHKARLNGYYGKDAAFGQSQRLAEKKFSRIPAEPGVYELSLPWKLDYPKGRSEVLYLGCTRDLRKRIASYSGNGLKNRRLKEFLGQGQVQVQFCRAQHYRALERKLLSNFRSHYGALPRANSVGA